MNTLNEDINISLSFSEFENASKKANVIPIYTSLILDLDTPVSIFLKTSAWQNKYSFLLESVTDGEWRGRYSFLGIKSHAVIKGKNKKFYYENIEKNEKKELKSKDPIKSVEEVMLQYKLYNEPSLSGFISGAVGFFSYDIIRYYENIVCEKELLNTIDIEDTVFCIPMLLVCFDHAMGSVKVIYNTFINKNSNIKDEYDKALKEIRSIKNNISKMDGLTKFMQLERPKSENPKWKSNTTDKEYCQMVEAAKEYIKAGDIFQTVLSKRFSIDFKYSPFSLYRTLRATNPSPYMFYLNFPETTIIGSSPEILVKKDNDEVIVRPIAGTIKRGKNLEEDEKLGKELLSDKKERAEHVMLVDLGRNDIGRVSEYGSVKVTALMIIEKYSHVMHIVSNVTGKIKKNNNSYDVLRAAFPAGTVSGAPKVRAMQIIEELEKEKRGVYAGCIGYFNFQGNMDTAIALRTMWVKNNTLYVQAGAGIVFDSIPEKENEEINKKAGALFKAVEIFYNENEG
ncbi:MAG: anthranilate synthase component I [Spirochaetia bacterium]|nr:anthranilate synthase component I [Spirochaetia bacterium]